MVTSGKVFIELRYLAFMGEVLTVGDLKFYPRDIFSNGRIGYGIPFSKKRKEISSLCRKDTSREIPVSVFLEEMSNLGPKSLQSRSDFSRRYNCWMWAFDNNGLEKYGSSYNSLEWKKLPRADIEDVFHVEIPTKDSVVVYFSNYSDSHWGIVDEIGDDIIVRSKWGGKEVFRHSLVDVPYSYGGSVMFFDKR